MCERERERGRVHREGVVNTFHGHQGKSLCTLWYVINSATTDGSAIEYPSSAHRPTGHNFTRIKSRQECGLAANQSQQVTSYHSWLRPRGGVTELSHTPTVAPAIDKHIIDSIVILSPCSLVCEAVRREEVEFEEVNAQVSESSPCGHCRVTEVERQEGGRQGSVDKLGGSRDGRERKEI